MSQEGAEGASTLGRAFLNPLPSHPQSRSSPTMIKYGINNIRELVGHRVNLQMIYDNPLCRLDA